MHTVLLGPSEGGGGGVMRGGKIPPLHVIPPALLHACLLAGPLIPSPHPLISMFPHLCIPFPSSPHPVPLSPHPVPLSSSHASHCHPLGWGGDVAWVVNMVVNVAWPGLLWWGSLQCGMAGVNVVGLRLTWRGRLRCGVAGINVMGSPSMWHGQGHGHCQCIVVDGAWSTSMWCSPQCGHG
jgi:hypothetical protein